VNSIAIPRKPGEAVGAITRLDDGKGNTITLNVEYNQLDALLKEHNPKGDVPDAQGYSLFPGNINVLIFALEPFKEKFN